MKKISIIMLSIVALLNFSACDEEYSPIFVAQEDVDGIVFVNACASEYLLSEET